MAVIAKICDVECPECKWDNDGRQRHISYDEPVTMLCPICIESRPWWKRLLRIGTKGKDVNIVEIGDNRHGAVLPGQFSDDVNSEMFVRADKHHPGRDMLWGWHKIQKLADKGRTRPIEDREIKMVKDRMALYARDYGEVKYNGIQ